MCTKMKCSEENLSISFDNFPDWTHLNQFVILCKEFHKKCTKFDSMSKNETIVWDIGPINTSDFRLEEIFGKYAGVPKNKRKKADGFRLSSDLQTLSYV